MTNKNLPIILPHQQNIHIDNDAVSLPRRQLVKGLALAPLAVSGMMATPTLARGLSWSDIKYVLRLHLVRFVAGLIFDVLEVVVVDYLKNHLNGRYDSYARLPNDKHNFQHREYKQAVVQIHPVDNGMTEAQYQAYKAQQRLQLSRDIDNQRFETIVKHLMDTQTRIISVGDNVSHKINAQIKADQLFNAKYIIFRDDNAERQYNELIEKTEVNVFNKLAV